MDMDPEVFFPPTGRRDTLMRAKAICRTCPVQIECEQHAVQARERYGVWAGRNMANPKERP